VLRTQITALREKGDFVRADALEKRLTNPAKWEAEQKAFRQTASPEVLAQTVQAGQADITQQWQATEQSHAVLNAQRQTYYDRIDRAQARNQALLDQPHSDADVATFRNDTTGEETRWHKAAVGDYTSAIQGYQTWTQANQEKIDLLNLNQQQLQIEAKNLDKHANQLRYLGREQQREKDGERSTQLEKMRQIPGMAEFADELEQQDAEFKQRAKDIERKYAPPPSADATEATVPESPTGTEERTYLRTLQKDSATRALQQAAQDRASAMQERMQAKAENISTLYTDWAKDLNVTDWQKDQDFTPRLQQEAKDRGLTESEARKFLNDSRMNDWDRPLVGPLSKGDNTGRDVGASIAHAFDQFITGETVDEPSRQLTDGTLRINPVLHLDPKAYQQAVNASTASPEAKKLAQQQFAKLHEIAGIQAVNDLENEAAIPGLPDFNNWRAAKLQNSPEFARKTLGTQATEFLAEMRTRGDVAQYADLITRKVAGGLAQVAGMVNGITALVTGPVPIAGEWFAQAAGDSLKLADMMSGQVANKGGADTVTMRSTGLLGELLPQLLPMMVGGGLLNATGKVAPMLAAAIMGGMQTGGLQQASVYQNLRAKLNPATGLPYTHIEAWAQAAPGAIASGIVTGFLTALGGKTGGEAALTGLMTQAGRNAARKALRDSYKNVWATMKTITGHGLGEYAEESPDELFSQISEEISTNGRSANVGRAIEGWIKMQPELMLAVTAMGAGAGTVGDLANRKSNNAALLAEDLAAADAEIRNYTDGTVDSAENDHRRNRAALAQAIARGVGLDGIEEVILNSAGWTRKDASGITRADGTLTKLKDYSGPNVLDVDSSGQVKLDKTYVQKLGTAMPTVAGLVGSKQTAWHKPGQIETAPVPAPLSPSSASPASSAKPSSGEVGPRAPAGTPQTRGSTAQGAAAVTAQATAGKPQVAAPAVSGAAAAPTVKPDSKEALLSGFPDIKDPADPRVQRAWEIANHLEMAGLDRASANLIATSEIRARGVNGKSVNDQVTSVPFNDMLNDLGMTGDRTTREGSAPLALTRAPKPPKVSQPTASSKPASQTKPNQVSTKTGWDAQWELAQRAKQQGVDLSSFTREQYADYAIQEGLRIDDSQLRMATHLRNATSMAEYQALRATNKPTTDEQVQADQDFSIFAQEQIALAEEKNAGTQTGEVSPGVFVRSGTRTSNSWLFWMINKGAGNAHQGATHKAYLGFSDIYKSLTPARMKAFMVALQKAGYNGDIKSVQDLASQSAISDQIVMHGASKADAELALKVGKSFFASELNFTDTGIDQDGKSHSQVLAERIAGQPKASQTPASQPVAKPAKKPDPVAPNNPAYPALRAKLAAKEISTIDVVREVMRLSGKHDTGDLQDILTDHLGMKKVSAAAAVETLRAKGELTGDKNDTISLAAGKKASDRQSTPATKGYTASKEFVPATQGALAENPEWARSKLSMLARTPPARRRWAYRFLNHLENTISQRGGMYDAFMVGGMAQQYLGKNKIGVVEVGDKVVLAINLDRMLADFSYLGDPRAAAIGTIMEEDIHAAQKRLEQSRPEKWNKASLAQQWLDYPEALKKTIWEAYRNVVASNGGTMPTALDGDPSAKKAMEELLQSLGRTMPSKWSASAAYHMQSEFLRMLVQGSIDPKSITETIDADPTLIQRIKDLLADLYDTLRSLIKGLPVSQAVTLDQQVTELKTALEQLGKPSSAEALRTKQFLRDPSAVAMQALKNGTVFDHLATQDALFTPQGLARVWNLLTPEMRAQVERLKKTSAPWLSKKRSDKASLTRDLLTFLLDPRAAEALAQSNLTASSANTASTSMVRRALKSMSDYFRSNRPDFAQTLASLDLPTAQVLQQMQALLVNARAQFEAAAAVQKLPTLGIAEPQAGDDDELTGPPSPAQESARAMLKAWMQEAQQKAFLDQAVQVADQMMPGVGDALQQRAIARQMAGQTWEALKARMEAVASGQPPSTTVNNRQRAASTLALPYQPAQRSAQAIEEALTDRDNAAQQNSSPAARDAIARRLMQEMWAAAILSTAANAERRYYLNQRELTPEQIRQIDAMQKVSNGDLRLANPYDQREISTATESGAPVRMMGVTRENDLKALGIRIGSDGTAYAAANAPVYIEGGTIIIKQSALDDLSQTLPITRQQFRLSEDQQRARVGLTGAPQPITADAVAQARAEQQKEEDDYKARLRLRQLEREDAASEDSTTTEPLIDPEADPATGRLPIGSQGDIISYLGPGGEISLTWPGEKASGEWDWFLELIKEYYDTDSTKTRRKRQNITRDAEGNVIDIKTVSVGHSSKLGTTNKAKKMAREGDLSTPASIVEYLILKGVITPHIPTKDGEPRNLTLGGKSNIDEAESHAEAANYDITSGLGNAVLEAISGREAARNNRQNDPARAAEMQTLRFERDTRNGPAAVAVHELAPLSNEGPTEITLKTREGDLVPVEVISYDWRPVDPDSTEADDFLDGHPAWRETQDGPERMVITVKNGTYYGQQQILGDAILRVHDTGNTGLGVDLGDGTGDFVTDEDTETPVETTETTDENPDNGDGTGVVSPDEDTDSNEAIGVSTNPALADEIEAELRKAGLLASSDRRQPLQRISKAEREAIHEAYLTEAELIEGLAKSDPRASHKVIHYWNSHGFTEIANGDYPEITRAFIDAVQRIPTTALPGQTIYRYQGYPTPEDRDAYLQNYQKGEVITIARPVNAFTNWPTMGKELAESFGGDHQIEFVIESPKAVRDLASIFEDKRPGDEVLYPQGSQFTIKSISRPQAGTNWLGKPSEGSQVTVTLHEAAIPRLSNALFASDRQLADKYRQPDGSYHFPRLLRGIGSSPNDAGVAGKGPYYTLKEHVAKMYAGSTGKVITDAVTLKRPLIATYPTLTKLQTKLYGRMLTGFEPELSAKFDTWMRERGYDGAILFEPEEPGQPAEVVKLAPSSTPQMRESVSAGQALFSANRLRDIAGDEADAAYAAGVRKYFGYLTRMLALVNKPKVFESFKPYMHGAWTTIANQYGLPEITRASAEADYFRLANQKSPAPGGISQQRPQSPTPRPTLPTVSPAEKADLEWEMGLSDNATPNPYEVPPGRRVVPRDEATEAPPAPVADEQQAEIDAALADPDAPKVAELGFEVEANTKDKKKRENIAKLKEIIDILKARPGVPKNRERIAKLEQRLEQAVEDLIQARGATLEQRQQAINEVYGPLAPSVSLRNTTTSSGSVVPHIMRGRALMVDLAGVPHVATKQVALTSVGSGHAPGVRFLPLAGDKSNWTGFINDTIKKVAPNLDDETDIYLEPYGGGLVYLQNLSFLQRTTKTVMIAVSMDYEPERHAIYRALANNDQRVINDLRHILKDLKYEPTTEEGEAFVEKLWGKADKRSHTAASQEAFEQLPNLIALLQKPNVKLMAWSDAETFRAVLDRATAGKRVTLLEDSNYADLFGEDTANQYATQDDHPELPGFGQAKTEFIGKDPAKLLAQKLVVYRAVLEAGGTIIATNNMNSTLLGGLLAEFGDQGHWFGYAHRTRPVKDGWLKHLDGKGVLWSTERPEYLAIIRKSGVTTAPKYGTETPNGYDYRSGPRRSAEENDRAAQPRREPSPHTGGSLAAAELLRQQIADLAGAGSAGTSESSSEPETPGKSTSKTGSTTVAKSSLATTAEPLPPGAKASPLDSAKWDAEQREQRRMAEQFDNPEDSFEDDLGSAADEALGNDFDEDGTPLASAPRRAYESMTFDPPFAAPFGQILSYHWMSKSVGGMESQRTSDWSQARTNAVTGRGIVHHFKVQKPDGTHTVSLETALGQLSDPQRQRLQGLIRAEQTRRADQASGQMALFASGRTPILSASRDVAGLRTAKDAWTAANYAEDQAERIVDQFYKPAAFSSIPPNAVLVPMPSTSGHNILPHLLAQRIAQQQGATFATGQIGRATARTEAKKKTTFWAKMEDPVDYQPGPEFNRLHQATGPIYLVEDVHNTGESWMAMRRLLEAHDIPVAGVATLTATELRVTSPRDIERLSEKVAQLTNTPLDKTTDLLHGLFHDSYKQWFNKAERSATGDIRQASRLLDAARAHAKARATEYRPERQDGQTVPATGNQDPLASAPRLAETALQSYLDTPDVNVPPAKQPAAKRAVRAAGRVATAAYPLPDAGGDAGKRSRLDGLRERAQRSWRGLIEGNTAEIAATFQEKDTFSTLLHDFINRDIPTFDIRGAVITRPADFAAFNLAVRTPYFETLKIAIVDPSMQVIHSQIVSVGALNQAIAIPSSVAGIIASARLANPQAKLAGWIIAHNHPSGNPTPSDADRRITRSFTAMGDVLGLPLLDHVITNGERYFSFKEAGMDISSDGITRDIDLRGSTNGKPKLPVLPTPPRPDFGNLADWEAIASGNTFTVDQPNKADSYLRTLRTADPDHIHVLYLDTRLALRGVERLPTDLTTAQTFQRIALGAAREGAHAFMLGLPSLTPTENSVQARADTAHLPSDTQRRFVRAIKERAHALGLQFADAMTQSPNHFFSFAERGLMEEPATYGLASSDKSLPSVGNTLNLRYVTPDGQDPENTRSKRQASNPLDSAGSVRSGRPQRLPSSPPEMLAWAQENGWLIDSDDLVARVGLGNEMPGGDEHDVWYDELTQRAIKLTLDTSFVQGSPNAYLGNLQRQNELFDTGFAFEGVVDDEGTPRFVISQPWIIGSVASQSAKDAYFAERGFDKASDDIYYSSSRDLLVTDARDPNVLQRPDGSVQPIDLQIKTVSPRQAERYETMVAAQQKGLASSDRNQPYTAAIEKAGIRPAISVNGKPYTGTPGMWHPEILAHYVWKNIYTPQQRRDDPYQVKAGKFALEEWMDSRGSGFDDFGFLTNEGKFIDREEAFEYITKRGLKLPEDSYSQRHSSLDSSDLLNLGASDRKGMTAQEAQAAGYTLTAYRGVSKKKPFNDSDTVWATTNRDVADSYAAEVFGYEDPDIVELRINPTGIPRSDMRKLNDAQREALGTDESGNPQQVGIYANSDDSPLGSSYPQTALHVPKTAALVKKADGLYHPLSPLPASASDRTPTASSRRLETEMDWDMLREDMDGEADLIGGAGGRAGRQSYELQDAIALFVDYARTKATQTLEQSLKQFDGPRKSQLRLVLKAIRDEDSKKSPLPAADRILAAAAKTNTNPSKAQIDAENYETGKVTVHGLRLSIENPAGSVRKGTDANGKAWEVTMPHHYGRILGTTGADKDHVDFFLGPDPTSPMAFVINQKKPGNGHFDEHKVMLGFTNPGTAARGYLDSYSPGWRGYSSIVPMTIPQFKHWLDTGKMGEAVIKAPVVSIDTAKPNPTRSATRPATTHTLPDGYQLTGPGLHLLPASVRAYHGTPHDVDKFSLAKIGTGEGAQVYGWGLYFASSKVVADDYAKKLGAKAWRLVAEYPSVTAEAAYKAKGTLGYKGNKLDAKREIQSELRDGIITQAVADEALYLIDTAEGGGGNLYTVELLPDEADFLDWDKPINGMLQFNLELAFDGKSVSDPSNFSKWDRLASDVKDGVTGKDLYDLLVHSMGGQKSIEGMKAASELLASLGIPGIRYLDGNSRFKIEQTSHAWEVLTSTGKLVAKEDTKEAAKAAMARLQTHNYVLFDDKLVKIIERNGTPIDTPALASSDKSPSAHTFKNPRLKAWANVPGQGNPDSLQTGYISGKHSADIAQRAKERGDIGLLITPLIPSYVNHTSNYPFIAVDNGVFSKATPFSPENFKAIVSKLASDATLRNKTLFVVAPDVVGDATATLQKFPSWAQWIHAKDLPVALAAQDGLEDMLEQIPWKDVDVLFIGGSTEWKTGELSMKQRAKWAKLFMETQRHGIPIHMGRVNTNERIAGVAQLVGASTVDGTFLAFGPDKNLPKLEEMLDRLNVDDKDLGGQTFPELGRAPSIQELYDLALDENIREPDQLGAYEPAAKEINAIRVSLGLPSMDGHRDQLELTLAASPRQILDANGAKQPLPAAPDLEDYQPWGKDKANRDSEWKRYRTDRAKWEAKVAEFASKQGNLGTFLAPLKSYPSGQAYHEARIITRVPGDATRWRATIFGQQPITATSIPVGDWANNAWVPVAHNEFETKAEAYQSTANSMPEGYTFSTQPLFASNRTTLAAAPRFVEQVSRASFNHLDRKLTAAIARQAKRVTSTDAVTAATQAAAAWWNQDTPGVSTLRSLKELVQRELIPETVLPREVMSAMREMQIKQSMGQQKALDVGRALSGKPKFSDLHYPPEFVENPMHREQMFTAMETGTVGTLPPALQKMAQQLRQMLVDAGREAVTQGRMNPDTFEGLRTNFMPRFTKEEAQANAGDFAKRFKLGVKDILAQRSTAFHITDQARKDKTGLPQIVSHSKGKWRFDSQQSRDAYYEDLINRQTLEGDLAKNDMAWMNRGDARALRAITPDMLKAPATMTKEQRDVVARVQRQLRQQFKKESPYEPADLVKDPVYAVMRYLAQMTHDNATAEFFNIIASNADWTSPTEMKGFKEIPDNDRFGALAGKFVRKDIADQVMELANTPEMVIQLYDTLLRLWKTGKTVLNPATHARNVIGNLPFAQFAGNNALNPANWTHYGHAFRTLRAGGDEYRHLYESGVLGADYASTELRAALESIVPVVQEDDSSNPLKHLLALGNRAAQWGKAHSLANVATLSTVGATAGFIAAGPLGALAGAALAGAANPIYRGALFAYRMEDDLFKAAAFFKARAMGMTIDQAAQHVRDWFPYYDKPTSTTLKFAGRTTMPFLSFFRESARIGAKAMAERPLSLAVTLAIPSLITALSAAVLGLDDKDKEDIKSAMRGKGAKLLGPTPLAGVPIFSMLIPWRTDSGQIQQIDLSSTHPMADFLANRVENWNNDPWWQAWSRSALANPMLGALYSAATGRDPFGDRTLWDSSYTPEEKARAILGHAWKTAVPPLAPGGTNWTMIEQSTRRQANKTLALRSPMQAVGRGIGGIDVRSADPDIYGLADAFRKRRGLPVSEGNTAYPTDAAGRARKALFEELVQPQPSTTALAKHLQNLNNLGKPIRTVSDVLDILDYRRPDGVINPKELRAPFRASLAPEARRVLDTALREFQKARAATPGAFAKARQLTKPTTRAPIADAP